MSVAVTAKLTVCDVLLEVTEILLSLTVKLEIEGAWVSDLVTVTDAFLVLVLPAASDAIATKVTVCEPNE